MMWHLPGIEHMAHGFNIIKGEESLAPLFQFGYCNDYIQHAVQDTYRDSFYILPDEVYAQLTPQCSYSTSSKVYSSAVEFANEIALNTASSFSYDNGVKFDLTDWIASVNVQAGYAMKDEKSVRLATELKRKRSGSIGVTEVSCETSKVQLTKHNFHPVFLADLAKATTEEDIVLLMGRYGTHFYHSATLGGKLRQICVLDGSYESKNSEQEIAFSAEASFAASVSVSALDSSVDASTRMASSIDSSTNALDQSEFERSSTKSTVITYGGPPGSFGPSRTSEAPSTFGDWAANLDLLPVPTDYQLVPIFNVIPEVWKTKFGKSVRQLWKDSEAKYKLAFSVMDGDSSPYKYSLYWKPSYTTETEIQYSILPNLGNMAAINGQYTVSFGGQTHVLMEQNRPGSYAPFNLRIYPFPIINSQTFEFIFQSSVPEISSDHNFTLTDTFMLNAVTRRSFFNGHTAKLLDWQKGTLHEFNVGSDTTKLKWETSLLSANVDIMFSAELLEASINIVVSRTFWEIVITSGERERLIQVKPIQALMLTERPYFVFYRFNCAFKTIKQVSLRIGTHRGDTRPPFNLRIQHLWVASNINQTVVQGYLNEQRDVFATPLGKSVVISNYDTSETLFNLYPLTSLKGFE